MGQVGHIEVHVAVVIEVAEISAVAMSAGPLGVAAAVAVVPAISDAQNFGTVSLNTGFQPDPRMMSGTSGGGTDASNFGSGCRGYVTPQPDHYLFLNTAFTWLRVFVRSDGDTTMVVRGPFPAMNTRCNDDRFGLNPAIEGNWAQGQYHIWVGSYSSEHNYDYEIGFTTQQAVH